MSDPALAATPNDQTAVVLFDGDCVVCSRWVDFLLRRDRARRFRFGALQSEAARALLSRIETPKPLPDAIVLVEGDRCSVASTAVLRILAGLPAPWPLFQVFRIVPRSLRDAVYSWIARRRYGWFGKRDACYVPTPQERIRFL